MAEHKRKEWENQDGNSLVDGVASDDEEWGRKKLVLGGLGGVAFMSQLVGTIAGVFVALVGGYIVYSIIHKIFNFRLTEEEEFNGADISIHKINSISSE